RPWAVPEFDETYSIGGLPTGRGGKFTASEIPEAMAEINEGRVKAAQALKDQQQG
ncbi:MAG: LLM class flavin-dependent oxidoreductase, partial [Nocardia sp.]|nr:LLM class flavin-dependent oxidoreductase [Nocardia sp.]